MQDFYSEENGLILFRKHFVRYLQGVKGTLPLKERLLTETNSQKFMEILMSYDPNISDDKFEFNENLNCDTYIQEEAVIS
jgi:hypothetical protein